MHSNKKSTPASGAPLPFNRQAGTARQLKPMVAQLKTGVSAQSVNRPSAPPVYRPQAVPRVLQTKRSAGQSPQSLQPPRQPVAPPVYRPEAKRILQPKAIVLQQRPLTAAPVAQSKMASAAQADPLPKRSPVSRPQSTVSYFPGGTVQRAKKPRGGGGGKKSSGGGGSGGGKKNSGGGGGPKSGGGRDVAVHNWDNVLAKYREGQAAKEVIAEFEAAGYYGSKQRPAILKALRTTIYAKTVIAHSLGDDAGGLRAGTDEKIQDCKRKLIAWAQANKAAAEAKPGAYSSSSRRSRGSALDEEAADMRDINTIHVVNMAKRGDRGAMTSVANWANNGNELAWERLVEMARSGNDNAVAELSRLATQGNDRAWALMLSEFQVHRAGSSGGALPEGYTPHPPFNMGQAGWKEQIMHHDPWEHVQGAEPGEWDE